MGYRLSDVLDRFVGMAKAPVCVEADPAQVRLLDEPVKIGDNRRLKELGWSPKFLLDQTLTDILHFWREAK
jgi:nucleoside-diphosphate-sugar epimerase